MMIKRTVFNYLCLVIAVFLTACADNSDPLGVNGKSAEQIYQQANTALTEKTYDKSIKLYNALGTTYPYGIYAQQGLLDLAYAYYQFDKHQEALDTIDQFITTYTTSPNMDYALYLKGYINYKPSDSWFDRFTKQNASELDTTGLKEAYKVFDELVKSYPKSKYALDAKARINEIVFDLATNEMIKARHYMGIKAYLATVNRTNAVITGYSDTSYIEEALAIQVVAYNNLDNYTLAKQTRQVLELNYPRSRYLRKDWRYTDHPWYKLY
jgi:outer membrane protein assembly factor BamD